MGRTNVYDGGYQNARPAGEAESGRDALDEVDMLRGLLREFLMSNKQREEMDLDDWAKFLRTAGQQAEKIARIIRQHQKGDGDGEAFNQALHQALNDVLSEIRAG